MNIRPASSFGALLLALVGLCFGLSGCQEAPQSPLAAADDHFLHSRYEEALTATDRAYEIAESAEEKSSIHLLRGRVLVDMYAVASEHAESEEATQYLQRAIDQFTKSIELQDNVEARYHRSLAYKLAGHAELADEDARIARKNDRTRQMAYQNESAPIILDMLDDKYDMSVDDADMQREDDDRRRVIEESEEEFEGQADDSDGPGRPGRDDADRRFPSNRYESDQDDGLSEGQDDTGRRGRGQQSPSTGRSSEDETQNETTDDSQESDDETTTNPSDSESTSPEVSQPRPRIPSSTWQPLVDSPFNRSGGGTRPGGSPYSSPGPIIPQAPTTGIGVAPASSGSLGLPGGIATDGVGVTRTGSTGIGGIGSASTTGLGVPTSTRSTTFPTGGVSPGSPGATGLGGGYTTMPSGIGQQPWMPNPTAMPFVEQTGSLPRFLRPGLPSFGNAANTMGSTPTGSARTNVSGMTRPGSANAGFGGTSGLQGTAGLPPSVNIPNAPRVNPNYSTSPLAQPTPGSMPKVPQRTNAGYTQP